MKKAAQCFFGILLVFLLPNIAWATQAQLACSPSTSTVAVGGTITTDIILNTRNYQIYGADAIVNYTTGILSSTQGSLVPVTSNTKWTSPLTASLDNSLGQFELDYGSSQSAYTSSGSIGKVTFTAIAPGSANVNIKFLTEYDQSNGVSKAWGKRNGTTLSNVLTDVVDCVYNVTSATTSPNPTGALPRTGNAETTILGIGGGGFILMLGLLLMKFI